MVMKHVISLLFELLTMAIFVSLTLLILNEAIRICSNYLARQNFLLRSHYTHDISFLAATLMRSTQLARHPVITDPCHRIVVSDPRCSIAFSRTGFAIRHPRGSRRPGAAVPHALGSCGAVWWFPVQSRGCAEERIILVGVRFPGPSQCLRVKDGTVYFHGNHWSLRSQWVSAVCVRVSNVRSRPLKLVSTIA